MEHFGQVQYEKKGDIAILTLDNEAQLNALSPAVREGLIKSREEANRDNDVGVTIIAGKGRAFCAGFDISSIKLLDPFNPTTGRQFLKEVMPVLAVGEGFSKPVIAAVNGLCLGGGLEVAISCDIIIASDKARFGVPEVQLGLLPGFACIRLHQIVGRAKAKELIMSGEPISAEEALRIGLVNKVVPHEELMEEALAFAKKLTLKPWLTVQFAKAAVNRQLGGEEMSYAVDAMSYIFAIEDAKEGVSAFLEKREPVWKRR